MMCVFSDFLRGKMAILEGTKIEGRSCENSTIFPRLRSHGALDQGTKSYGPYSLLISWVYLGILISIMGFYTFITNSLVFFTFCMIYCFVGYLIHGCPFMGIFMQTNHDTWGYHGIYINIYIQYICNQLLLNTWVDWINWNIFLWKANETSQIVSNPIAHPPHLPVCCQHPRRG